MALSVGSLFSGCGLLDYGLHLAGWEHAWFCERDEFRADLLGVRFPGVPVYRDVAALADAAERSAMPPLTDDQFAEAVAMYDGGFSVEAIAERFPVTRQALWQRMRNAGVEMRPQHRYGDENHFHRGGEVEGADWANNKVEKAILRGVLVRPDACSACGGPGKPYSDGRASIQAHHDDYNRPLEVRWLCQPCHHDWHWNNQPVPRDPDGGDARGIPDDDVSTVDVIAGGFPVLPARASAQPVNARVSAIPRLRFGERCSESFAHYDPATSSWRTSQLSLLSTTEPSSERFSGGWPRAGTTRNGTAFRLPPSAPLTAATASSSPLLPTPSSWDGRDAEPDRQVFEARREREKAKGRNGNGFGLTLPMAVQLLPTPTGSYDKRGAQHRGANADGGPMLEEALSSGASTSPPSAAGNTSSAGLRLNPSFVEWMMGAPEGWTDPGCRLSATGFSSRQGGSSDGGS